QALGTRRRQSNAHKRAIIGDRTVDRTIRDDSRGLRDIARRARTRAIWTSCGRAERRGAQCAADAPVPGHFGLAVQDYTHAKRLLKAALAGEPAPYGPDALAALAAHCTTQEDNAAKVERRVRKSAAALLLSGRIGQRFAAIVTGAADKGTTHCGADGRGPADSDSGLWGSGRGRSFAGNARAHRGGAGLHRFRTRTVSKDPVTPPAANAGVSLAYEDSAF